MRLRLILLAAAATLSAGAANAASVEIRDVVARVTVVPQDRADIKVDIIKAHPELPLQVSVSGDRTVVDGGLRRKIRDCNDMSDKARVRVSGVGRVSYEELPQVVIYTPKAVEVAAGGAVQGAIGRSASLKLSNSGCAAWTIADVAGVAEVHQSGAGEVRMGQAERLDVRLSGAANIHATRIRQGGLEAQLSGAGNVKIDEVRGPVEARVSGVGQIEVDGGRATLVRASVSGIGQVEFDGSADNLDASISGLGSIRVKEVTGSVSKSVSGGGSVKVGNRPS
jgi:hypothetical protein